jgi:hypothetical protein
LRGRGATCSSTETRAKKNNIGTLDRLAKFAHGFSGGLKRPFGISPGSEAVGCHRAKRRFSGCHRSVQRLLVRVQRHRFKGQGSSDGDAVRDVHTGIADAEQSENRFLTGATIKLAGGHMDVTVPHANRPDEIGRVARALGVSWRPLWLLNPDLPHPDFSLQVLLPPPSPPPPPPPPPLLLLLLLLRDDLVSLSRGYTLDFSGGEMPVR